MANYGNFIFPTGETHARMGFNGRDIYVEGLPEGKEAASIPDLYKKGAGAVYSIIESLLPGVESISFLGIWFEGEALPFVAFDLWAQGEREGFYFPQSTAATLFRDNGIPYFHKP